MKKHLIALIALASIATAASAQELMTIKTGGLKGAYYGTMANVAQACGIVSAAESPNGTTENLDALARNTTELAVVQADALAFRASGTPSLREDRVQVVIPLFKEEVHIWVRNDVMVGYKPKDGMFGKETPGRSPNDIDELKGLTVASWGGSAVTSNILSSIRKLGWTVNDLKSEGNAIAAFNSGKAHVIIAVSGQPSSTADSINPSVAHLISVNAAADIAKANPKFFSAGMLSYSQYGVNTVQTLAVQSYLVSQFYPEGTEQYQAVTNLKACIAANINNFRFTKGNHPKWKEIDPNGQTPWAMFKTGTPSKAAKAGKK